MSRLAILAAVAVVMGAGLAHAEGDVASLSGDGPCARILSRGVHETLD